MPVYECEDSISGKVQLQFIKGKKFDHQGVKIELIGRIETYGDKTLTSDFFSLSQNLEPAGSIQSDMSFPFNFQGTQKQFESYYGNTIKLRYILRATLIKQYAGNTVVEKDFAVQKVVQQIDLISTIKMEVGIEDCVHIEFEFDKSKYHLNDVISGKVYFLLVRIKISHMELQLIKRETIGSGQAATSENDTVVKYEIMDGAPIKGEIVPIRLYLKGFELTPSYINVNNRYTVKYFLNLVLVDEEDRRYFKQQEVFLWRNVLG